MNRKHSFVFRFIAPVAVTLLVILLYSCNLRTSTPSSTEPGGATSEPVEGTDVPVAVELDYAPGIVSVVAWIDQSYVVYVPGGEFIMGEDVENAIRDYEPAHSVDVDPFWIHQTEVTNRMYASCVAAGVCEVPYRTIGKPYWYASGEHALDPVVGVSWEQAATYCEWIEGRLPTEAEWEKAARGTEGDPHPWGDEEPACNLLNFSGCQEVDQPVRVRTFFDGASPFLLADTAGNVSEWVGDWYKVDYYSTSPASNPSGPASGTYRVIRGSNYDSQADALGIYLRDSALPGDHQADTGFRCVLTGETVGNPPPPVCEAAPYIPVPPSDHPFDFYPPEFVPSSFCLPDPASGLSTGNVTLTFADPVAPGIYDIHSSTGLGFTAHFSGNTIGLHGPGIPIDTTFTITVCFAEAPSLPVMEAECPVDYYFDDETDTCRYGTPEMHDTPESCGSEEGWVPGYGCLHACPPDADSCFCPMGFDFYPYEFPDEPGDIYTICLPPDGPEECLTNPDCSASNRCPEGFSYVTEMDCCELPPDMPAWCPPLYTLKLSEEHLCIPEEVSPLCTSVSFYIPNCDEPPPSLCINPESYHDPTSCEAAYCRWELGFPGAPNGRCTYP
jgi:hypothetical protein